MQWVLRQSYLESTQDLYHFAEKVKHLNNMKKAIREHMAVLRNIRQQFAGLSPEEASKTSLAPKEKPLEELDPATIKPRSEIVVTTSAQRAKVYPEAHEQIGTFMGYRVGGANPTDLEQAIQKDPSLGKKLLDVVPYMTGAEVYQIMKALGGVGMRSDDGKIARLFPALTNALSDAQVVAIAAELPPTNPPEPRAVEDDASARARLLKGLRENATQPNQWGFLGDYRAPLAQRLGQVLTSDEATRAAFGAQRSETSSGGDLVATGAAPAPRYADPAQRATENPRIHAVIAGLTAYALYEPSPTALEKAITLSPTLRAELLEAVPHMTGPEIKHVLLALGGGGMHIADDELRGLWGDITGRMTPDQFIELNADPPAMLPPPPRKKKGNRLKQVGLIATAVVATVGAVVSFGALAGVAAVAIAAASAKEASDDYRHNKDVKHDGEAIGKFFTKHPATADWSYLGDLRIPFAQGVARAQATIEAKTGISAQTADPDALLAAWRNRPDEPLPGPDVVSKPVQPALDTDPTDGSIDAVRVIDRPPYLIAAGDKVGTVAELDAAITNLEEQLNSVGDDAQLANIDLQNSLQKQQQTLQMLSNIAKSLHDTAMAIVRQIGG